MCAKLTYYYVMSDLRRTVKTWAQKVGKQTAAIRLISQGVSTRAAEKLCAGTYPSEPKAIREKILREIAKDGIVLKTRAEAS